MAAAISGSSVNGILILERRTRVEWGIVGLWRLSTGIRNSNSSFDSCRQAEGTGTEIQPDKGNNEREDSVFEHGKQC